MRYISRTSRIAALTFALALPGTAVLSAQGTQGTQAPVAKHHSKLKGAAAGAVAGHALGGHAVAGAAIGAMVQHHRNHRKS
jgi:hypothetical protein